MSYWGGWRRQHQEFRRRVDQHRNQLRRDTEFFDGNPLYVTELRWTDPFDAEPPVAFVALSIGLAHSRAAVRCTPDAHAEWLAVGLDYLDAVSAATDRTAIARERYEVESEKLGNRLLWWRMRDVERDWVRAIEAYRAEVAAADAAYHPTRETVARHVAAEREVSERRLAEERARTEERRAKARELAALPLWGILVTGRGRDAEVTVHRHDLAPESPLPTDTQPHRWEEAEPLTGFALEPAVRALRETGASVRWEAAAVSAVEEEFGYTLRTWWEDLFPQSDLFRPPRPRGTSSTYTGTGHHSSYGTGGFSCASVH
ncbi:hypothetical protein [Streptodolium elevatio]|uniref:Uncharacterized protein n=1 Tax=Streptodolium elevatio TaxID=3157996 RepID=A0ABV3DUI0_9ACTN